MTDADDATDVELDTTGPNQARIAQLDAIATTHATMEDGEQHHYVSLELTTRLFGPDQTKTKLPVLLFNPVRLADLANAVMIAGLNAWGTGFVDVINARKNNAPDLDLTDTHPETLAALFPTPAKDGPKTRLGFPLEPEED